MGEPALRGHAIELAGLDQRIVYGLALADFFGAEKQIVFTANSNGPHGAFCGIVIQFEKTVFQTRPHLRDIPQQDQRRKVGFAKRLLCK